jgi:ABC-type glycerol-3-phosphate transport system permease component
LREPIFILILVLIMLPGILLLIPMFRLVVDIGWSNTLQGVVVPWVSVQIVVGIFIMRTFFESLPSEYFEAARLDGASEVTLLLRIALPLAQPALATLGVLTLLFAWNDLLWPLVVLYEEIKQPVAVGILQFGTAYGTDYGATYAAYVLASIPLIAIFSFASRRFMEGLQGGISV